MVEHAINGIEILLALIVEALGLDLKLMETSLCIDEDGIFGMLADVKLGLKLLWRLFIRQFWLVVASYLGGLAHWYLLEQRSSGSLGSSSLYEVDLGYLDRGWTSGVLAYNFLTEQ